MSIEHVGIWLWKISVTSQLLSVTYETDIEAANGMPLSLQYKRVFALF